MTAILFLQLSSHLVGTLGSPSQFTYICAGLSPPLNFESNRSWCWQSLLSTLGGGTAASVPTNVTTIAIVVTFSWNTWVSITIHLHLCEALPSPQCWVKQILMLAIIVINIGGRYSYKCSNKCDDDCLWRGTKERPIFLSPRAKLTPKMDPA